MPEAASDNPTSILLASVMLLVGVGLLLGGGHWLVEGAVRIARRTGVSTLLIGLTVVAFGTSAPELAFNLIAALDGKTGLSFGNVIGSNIANIGLVLGFVAILKPLDVHSRVLAKELPLLILVSIGLAVLAWMPIATTGKPGFSRLDGGVLLGGFAFVSFLWYRLAQSDRDDDLTAEAKESAEAPSITPAMLPAIGLFVLGLFALVLGGNFAKTGAVGIARALQLSDALIGLTIVAFATSLPELLTTVVAARKGHTDLAVGNVVGSNLFNILLVLGATSVCADVPLPTKGGWTDLGVMVGLTLVLLPLAMNQRRIKRAEGVFLMLVYVGYIAFRVTIEFS